MKRLRILLPWVMASVYLQAAQLPVALNSAGSFTVLAGSTVTNTGPSIVNGNVGLNPGSAVTGFPPGGIVGTLNVDNGPAVSAEADLTTAYNNAAGRTSVPSAVGNVSGNLDGQTLMPGLYNSTSTLGLGVGGVLTLNGQGNANAVFIFQVASALTTGSGSRVVLINGANAANVFWQVGSSATLGTYSVFQGTIMAYASVTLTTGATLNGRALAENAAVTLDSNSMVNPGPPITTSTPPPLTAVTCPLPGAVVGTAYSSLLVATGGTPSYTFAITPGSLPTGLTLNPTTGAVTGTPTTAVGSPFSFTVQATDSATPPVTVTNNTCAIAVTPAASSADVSIVKTGPSNAAALANITYQLAVSNAGPGSAAGVTVTDILPAGTTFVSATSTLGSCTFTSAVTCSLGTMANGGSATIALVVVGPSSSGPVANTATVVSTTPDPNTVNNHSSWTVTVTAPASAPTLSTWGLGVLGLLLAGYSMHCVRKAHTVQIF
jgi:type VI secretion system secreted protein VgrG